MKTVVLLSGGLDSSTLLYWVRDHGDTPLALSIVYGQRHVRELYAAQSVAAAAGAPHATCFAGGALSPIFASARSSQVGQGVGVPEGHYAEDNMAITVVPNRNMLLLAIAGAFAVSEGAGEIAYAAHAGDHAQYPDCRPEFIQSCAGTLALGTPDVLLSAPFQFLSKADIVREAARLAVPTELTWSCYKGGQRHCGRCGTCVERAEAFSLAGVPDPTVYEDATFWQTVCAKKNGV
jgi:7-cyano-7-deazaguanine synthase